jgi:alkylation response protein AidB-like acyl-CoA dehydrogenase
VDDHVAVGAAHATGALAHHLLAPGIGVAFPAAVRSARAAAACNLSRDRKAASTRRASRGAAVEFGDSPQQAAFRAEVRSFLETRAPDRFRARLEGRSSWQPLAEAMREWRETLRERGWIAPAWPQEYGGAEMGVMEQFILNEEFAEARIPHPAHSSRNVGPTLIVHGSEEQKAEHLERIRSGEVSWAQGFSEPGAGSDLASLSTRAVRDGDDYVVNGQKIWTSNAHLANWIFMLVRTDPDAPKHRGISYLIAPMDTPGIQIRPLLNMLGVHQLNEVFFEDVRVPARYRVGEEHRGWYVATTTLDFERSNIGSAVDNSQALDGVLRLARQTNATRDRPALRAALADRYVEVGVLRTLSYRIISLQAGGVVPNYEASMAKLFHTELIQRTWRTGMQVGGLFAQIVSRDTPYRRARRGSLAFNYMRTTIATVGGGTSEVQRNIIATRGLGLPRG